MDLDEDVLEMVRRQLERDPPPSTTALYGRAVRINDDIYELSLRQFHAKYPLRVKREKARGDRERAAAADGEGGDRERAAETSSAGSAPESGREASSEVDEDAGRRHLFGPEDTDDGAPAGASGTTPRGGAAGGRDGAATRPTGSSSPEGPDAGSGKDGGVRARIRRVFMRLAREIAEAERPEALVDVVERMPDRVDELARIVGGRRP